MDNMDESWKHIYNMRASKELPVHEMSYWTEEGFKNLVSTTKSLMKDMDKNYTVLDVGCGPGYYCDFLTDMGFKVRGVDYSEKVIERATNNYPEIDFSVEDAYNLSFEDKSFDVVLCIGVLQCVYDHERIIHELARVSKKYVIISTLLRSRAVADPMQELLKKLAFDTWPTKEYHPSEIIPLLQERGFEVDVITKRNGKKIKDGFFLVCKKASDSLLL